MLVSNAGITRDGLLMRMKEEDFTDVLDANLTAAYRVAKRAAAQDGPRPLGPDDLRLLRRRACSARPGQANYAASKAGLVGLARSIARELGSRNITANVVAPGFVATDMTAELPEKRQQEILGQVPLGRYADGGGDRRRRPLPRERRGGLHHRGGRPGRRRTGDGALMGMGSSRARRSWSPAC